MSLELQRLWKLLKVHSVELHAKLLRARAACVPRRAREPDTSRVGPMVCAWVRHFARGSDGMRVGSPAPDRGLTASKRGESHHERPTVGLAPRRGRHQTGGIAPIEARHAGDTPKGGF